MAWLSSYDDTNKVVESKTTRTETIMSIGLTPAKTYTRTISELNYTYRGMTYNAADTCLGAMIAAGHIAELVAGDNGGSYSVRVAETTMGDWTEVVP